MDKKITYVPSFCKIFLIEILYHHCNATGRKIVSVPPLFCSLSWICGSYLHNMSLFNFLLILFWKSFGINFERTRTKVLDSKMCFTPKKRKKTIVRCAVYIGKLWMLEYKPNGS